MIGEKKYDKKIGLGVDKIPNPWYNNSRKRVIKMIEKILMLTGLIAWGVFSICFLYRILTSEIVRLPFRRPWYCIKHLLPWFWIDEARWAEFQQGIDIAMSDPREPEWKRQVELKRYGHFGIFIDNLRSDWWQTKYHLFIVKGA